MARMPAMMITRLTTMARTGRRRKRSVILMTLAVGRSRLELWLHLRLLLHDHRGRVFQFEGALADHFFSGTHAFGHRHEVAPGPAEAHEALMGDLDGLPLGRGRHAR